MVASVETLQVGDALVQVQGLREKARGQLALITERRRGVVVVGTYRSDR